MQRHNNINKHGLQATVKTLKNRSAFVAKVVAKPLVPKTPARVQLLPFKQKNPYQHVMSKVFSGIKKPAVAMTKPVVLKQNSIKESSWNMGSGSGRHDTNVPSPIVAWFRDEEGQMWDERRVHKSCRTLEDKGEFANNRGTNFESGTKKTRIPRDDMTIATWNEDYSGFKTPPPTSNRLDDLFSSVGQTPGTPASDYRPGSQIHALFGPKPLEQTPDNTKDSGPTSCFSDAMDLLQPLEDPDPFGSLSASVGCAVAVVSVSVPVPAVGVSVFGGCPDAPRSAGTGDIGTVVKAVPGGVIHGTPGAGGVVQDPATDDGRERAAGRGKSALRMRLEDIRHRANHIHELVAALAVSD